MPSPSPLLVDRPALVPAGAPARAERDRVAAELQAIVARALAAMAARASTARALLGVDDAAAGAHVAAIPEMALDALDELRRLLCALTGHRLTDAERACLARDVHDSVGHGLSVAGVLAGAAQAVLPTDRDAARRALEQLQGALDETRGELAALLGPLDLGAEARHRPAPPAPDGLTALVRRAAVAGQRVGLVVDGDALEAVAPGVLASLHRIAQEALTNARKHAPGAAVDLHVEVGADAVRVEVANGPATQPVPGRAGGCRRGIAGMRERARLLGGALDARPVSGGGFRVTAVLPR